MHSQPIFLSPKIGSLAGAGLPAGGTQSPQGGVSNEQKTQTETRKKNNNTNSHIILFIPKVQLLS